MLPTTIDRFEPFPAKICFRNRNQGACDISPDAPQRFTHFVKSCANSGGLAETEPIRSESTAQTGFPFAFGSEPEECKLTNEGPRSICVETAVTRPALLRRGPTVSRWDRLAFFVFRARNSRRTFAHYNNATFTRVVSNEICR